MNPTGSFKDQGMTVALSRPGSWEPRMRLRLDRQHCGIGIGLRR